MPIKDPEQKREADRRWRAANRERVSGYNRQYRRAHPEVFRAAEARRRARGRRPPPNTPRYNWEHRLKTVHGMTAADWQAMWDAQAGRCYLCEDPLPDRRGQVSIDHDHSCCGPAASCARCRRGLACRACNLVAGLAGDDPARLARITANLARAVERQAAGGTTRVLLANP